MNKLQNLFVNSFVTPNKRGTGSWKDDDSLDSEEALGISAEMFAEQER